MLSTFSSDAFAAARISFARGRSAATLSGTIPAGATREYVIGVRRNQTMTISVDSGNSQIVIDVDDVNGHLEYGDGFTQIETNANGDHWITLKNEGGRATRYTMTVSVR
jgi:hypothetical protein